MNTLKDIFQKALLLSSFVALAGSIYADEQWAVIMLEGDRPNRMTVFIDIESIEDKSTPTDGRVKGVTMADVKETPGSPQYTKIRLEFKCDSDKFRDVEGASVKYDGTLIPLKAGGVWVTVPAYLRKIRDYTCNEGLKKAVQTSMTGKQDVVDSDKLPGNLRKIGLDGMLIVMSNDLIPDLDSVLEFYWKNMWQAKRPSVTGVAKSDPVKPNPAKPGTGKAGGRADALVKSGKSHVDNKNYGQALTDFAGAIKADPKNADAYFYRGYIYGEAGEFDLAVINYSKAISLNPSVAAYYNRGMIYFTHKHIFNLAEADFTKAIELDPQDAQNYFVRANLYESMGKDLQANADRGKFKSLGGEIQYGKRRRTLFPNIEFDANAAAAALEPGTSTITGRACASTSKIGIGGKKFYAAGVPVVLYPVTPYLEKWHELRKKKEDKKTGVFFSREASKHGIAAITNDKGEFVFSRIKPGKYFIQTIFNFRDQRTARVHTGSDTTQEGNVQTTTNYYEEYDYYVDHSKRFEKFIVVKSEGESQKVELNNMLAGCGSWIW